VDDWAEASELVDFSLRVKYDLFWRKRAQEVSQPVCKWKLTGIASVKSLHVIGIEV